MKDRRKILVTLTDRLKFTAATFAEIKGLLEDAGFMDVLLEDKGEDLFFAAERDAQLRYKRKA